MNHRELYRKIRRYTSNLVVSGYEITNLCNLKCEGCLFYEGEDYGARTDIEEGLSREQYAAFFQKEVERGVTFPQIAGAEPSLVQERLKIAGRFWKYGVVYTNGIVPIDRQINFMLHVSVWTTDQNSDRNVRGAAAFQKALKNYAGDRRAVFNFTMNHQNLDEIEQAIALCREHDVRLTFNHYSPTRQYRKRLKGESPESYRETFRISSDGENLMLTREDYHRIRQTVDEMIDRYPDTVVYSHTFNAWINQPGSLYQIDSKSGMAVDCAVMNDSQHRQYKANLTFAADDCCSSNINCEDCRIYPSAYPLYLSANKFRMRSEEGRSEWIDVMDTWCRLHIVDWDLLPG